MKRVLLVVLVVAACSGCNVSARLQDGYDVGDVSAGMVENYRAWCSPVFKPLRVIGRWTLRLVAIPAPDTCMGL